MDTTKAALNTLLAAIKIGKCDRFVSVRENGLADANFVITHLMKQIFDDDDAGLCLVILHNTIGHHHNVGKRLGYDFLRKIKEGSASTVEPLKMIVSEIDSTMPNRIYAENKEDVCRLLFADVRHRLHDLLNKKSGCVYLIIDDLSHLLDLGVDVKFVLNFVNSCVNLDERVRFVVSTHVSNDEDAILSNALGYLSDVTVDVAPLKTGRSFDVSGIITVKRTKDNHIVEDVYHYKARDKEIRTFKPGESLNYLLK